jgi:hypothetical protein
MNFAYLLIPGCNNHTYSDGIILLHDSVTSLKKYLPTSKIYIYYGYDDTNMDKIDNIKSFIQNNNLIGRDIGKLKHNFDRIEYDHVANSIVNPYRLNILIEKIYILLNHENEEICFVDLDTKFKPNISNYSFNLNKPILYNNENHLLSQRGLDNFFKIINYNLDNNSRMFNSGFIYIPLNKRKQIAQEAIDLVLNMNKYSDKLRLAKDLDEQIALSIIIFKYYNTNIDYIEPYLIHSMGKHIK